MKDDIRIPEKITVKNADSRGRITIGSEYADKKVRVAIVNVLQKEEEDGQKEESEEIKCPICEKSFDTVENFKKHVNEEL